MELRGAVRHFLSLALRRVRGGEGSRCLDRILRRGAQRGATHGQADLSGVSVRALKGREGI